ncbi:S9 family peptidase [Echinicola vietnamensis]|uniref:Proline-specific endopeptidase n=1 Tax=Echinicola vietnamensis (strain DSM 17526 / LMG 23754 / KMM 6221) TaxID=926556 RepID=L0FZW5_ECHVK|nr:oligopeptidase B [Echinicola vietnamensis]AGA78553.1 protease II [Echinicola vietnamensis DSM 17526]
MKAIKAPKAPIKIQDITYHEHTRRDPYYWMNERENPEVIQYLNEENAFLKASLAHTEPLQEKLYQEMKNRIKEDDESVPYFRDGYYYYTKFVKGGEYPVFCRKEGSLQHPEEILLDVNLLAKEHDYFNVNAVTLSYNQQLLAHAEDHVGRRVYNIKIKDLSTGSALPDQITEVTGNMVWANDNKTLFYSKQDPNTLRAYQIYQHTLGTPQEEDILVYEEADETFTCHVAKSKSKDYIFIVSESTVSSEIRYLDAHHPTSPFHLIQERERDLEYSVEHFEDHFLILTNHQHAKNYKLVKAPTKNPDKSQWVDIIAHRDDTLLEGFEVFGQFLVLEERSNGLTKIQIIPLDGSDHHYITFDDPTYAAWLGYNPQFDTTTLRFGYNSLTTPSSTYDYDMVRREKVLLKQQEVQGGFDPSLYQSERIWATAQDGTKIPISLVYKTATFKKDGSNPLLQYAYGSYGFSTDPVFSSSRLSLLDRGFVFAIAHIRGGQELGRHWYDDGKMLKKRNTFTDFITCSEHLLRESYTSLGKLFAMGGSAGGMLMGTIINMRPDLYEGVIAAVPFVDVVTTMLDESIPLTTGEFDEWGNPKNKEYYDYMLSYSPYDNVEKKEYPHLLVTSGLHDSQVQYWEPTKWVAKLRVEKTDKNMLLLYTNMDAGHGGASGRFHALKETAMEYAFLLDLAEKGQNQPPE